MEHSGQQPEEILTTSRTYYKGTGYQNAEQAFTAELMEHHQLERFEGTDVSLVTEFPNLLNLKTFTLIGGLSWSSRLVKKRWIHRNHALNIGAGWCTPSDVARDYLDIKYGAQKRRVTSAQYKIIKRHVSPPLYASPVYLPDATYVDIQSAYWSVLKAVGWDVEYHPGKFLGVGSSVSDFPFPEMKLARNCLVSAALPSTISAWTGENLIQMKMRNRHVNLVLWRLCMDVLNGFAIEMIRAGAVYVHTDGFIMPTPLLFLADEIAHEWNLPLRIKDRGVCEVKNVGYYVFGGKVSNNKRKMRDGYFQKIYNPGLGWLKPKFAFHAARGELRSGLL